MSSPALASEPAPRTSWLNRIGLAAMTVARLALALGMMPYAISKLFDLQFQVGAANYAKPLGDATGIILTWAFLGYSPVFQFLLGAFEFIPSVLLLFARTRRLGALLMFPVVLNVTMINYFLDLWPGTRLISSVFLALNTFLILYDYRMYVGFLSRLLDPPVPIANRKWRIASKIVGFLAPAAVMASFLVSFHSQVASALNPITDFIGERQINRAGTWKIESLRIGGQSRPDAAGASLYFNFDSHYTYDHGTSKRIGKFEADKTRHTFQIQGIPFAPNESAIQGGYRVNGDHLFLDGIGAGRPISLVLRRDRWGHDKP